MRKGSRMRWLLVGLACLMCAQSATASLVDLSFEPLQQTEAIGEPVDIRLIAASDGDARERSC